MQRVHRHLIALRPDTALDIEFDEPAGRKISLNHPDRQAAPAQPTFEKSVLGAKVGQPPSLLCNQAELPAFREGRPVGEHELDTNSDELGGIVRLIAKQKRTGYRIFVNPLLDPLRAKERGPAQPMRQNTPATYVVW
jgi:hypothetical protein